MYDNANLENTKDILMNTWPTPLESDGTAPVLMTLLTSSEVFLVSQAVYLLAAGAAVKNSGYEIKAFQQPVTGNGTGLTIPLLVKSSNGQLVAVYTNSEPWTTEAIVRLMSWIRDLLIAWVAKMSVVVIAQHDSDEVRALPQVFQFIRILDAKDTKVKLLT